MLWTVWNLRSHEVLGDRRQADTLRRSSPYVASETEPSRYSGIGIMRNSVFDFAVEVDRQISTLTREQFYLRTGRAKRLLEELYPLSRFALRLKYLGNDPEVEAFENDGPLDGVIHWRPTHHPALWRRREKNLKEYCREDFGLKLSGFISLDFIAVSSIALKLVGMWNEPVGMGNLCKSLK